MAEKRIDKILVTVTPEESPDLSFLGEYSDQPGEQTIDRQERGEMKWGELRYWNPGRTGDGEAGIVADYQRHEAYNCGEWGMTGIGATAEILLPFGADFVCQQIRSGGLWGVESDAPAAYAKEIAEEELSALGDLLAEIGFSDEEIATTVADWSALDMFRTA